MDIDMFIDAMSLPGLAVFWLFKLSSTSENPIKLLDPQDRGLYPMIKKNLVGGPSIVFHRYHEKGITSIRQQEFGNEAKRCERILGVDANALYLWCMMRTLPCGFPTVYYFNADDDLINTSGGRGSKVARGWLTWMSEKMNIEIVHEFNGKEIRIGKRNIPVDGFCSSLNTVYQFHGCFWHGHQCIKSGNHLVHPYKGISSDRVYNDTMEKEQYIKELGYKLVRVWECEWEAQVNQDKTIKKFLAKFFRKVYPKISKANAKSRVDDIKNGKFFGLIECDIEVPTSLKDYFSEMPPIFKNVLVGRKELGTYGMKLAEKDGHLRQPQRMLIGSMKGERILLFSELAKWYLNNGLKITRIYTLNEYTPSAPFKDFGESVSNARREGDSDPSKAILADTNKLIGNSCYGKTIVNKDKHKTIKYIDGDKEASFAVGKRFFDSMEEIGDHFYEVFFRKERVSFKFVYKINLKLKNPLTLMHYFIEQD
jgi:G:T-mismatch repair DNA endonuclease (very short patch repair protein)